MKYNSSVKIQKLILAFIFCFLLFCNFFTPIFADDYAYHFRFDNWERVESVSDIIPSMIAHRQSFNGRLVAHSLVQLFELLPKPVFNVINAALFVLMLNISFSFVKKEKANNLLLILLFCAIWLLFPAFGEVCLWLDGSVNYLWAICAGMLFLRPYLLKYTLNRGLKPWAVPGLLLLSFISGAFQETMAAATFVLCVVLLLLSRFLKKNKIEFYWLVALVFYAAGILFMAMQPAELSVKSLGLDFTSLYKSFINMLHVFKLYAVPIFVYVSALVLCIMGGKDRERMILSAVFFLGFICANGVMVLATIYPSRCASPAVLFLILADAMLLTELFADYRKAAACLSAMMIVAAAFWCVYGAADVVSTGMQMWANERTILQGKAEGQTDFMLPHAYASTKYSVANEILYPATEIWANDQMCRYYGVNSIQGYDYYSYFFEYIHAIDISP